MSSNCINCRKDCNRNSIDKSCVDIIESIALVETSISHILNAECEKIQKILECADCVCEIMAVNESVSSTITKITHLEHVLYAKLELVSKIMKDN